MRHQIRWIVKSDSPRVLDIEWLSFQDAWTGRQFQETLKRREVIGLVSCDEEMRVAGYAIYEICDSRIDILNIAVHPLKRREGHGRALLRCIERKLGSPSTQFIASAMVRETNLVAQKFFRSCDWRAEAVMRNGYAQGEDAYEFKTGTVL